MFRGRNEGLLHIQLDADPQQDDNASGSHCEHLIASHYNILHRNRPADDFLAQVVQWTWKIKIALHMETELFSTLRERAEEEATAGGEGAEGETNRERLSNPKAVEKTLMGYSNRC